MPATRAGGSLLQAGCPKHHPFTRDRSGFGSLSLRAASRLLTGKVKNVYLPRLVLRSRVGRS